MAPPTHSHITPGLRKNRNVASVPSPLNPIIDEYRSLNTPYLIEGVPIGSFGAEG